MIFVKVQNENDGKMICCDLGITNKNLICFALLTNSSKWFYPADGYEVFLDTFPCDLLFIPPPPPHPPSLLYRLPEQGEQNEVGGRVSADIHSRCWLDSMESGPWYWSWI